MLCFDLQMGIRNLVPIAQAGLTNDHLRGQHNLLCGACFTIQLSNQQADHCFTHRPDWLPNCGQPGREMVSSGKIIEARDGNFFANHQSTRFNRLHCPNRYRIQQRHDSGWP